MFLIFWLTSFGIIFACAKGFESFIPKKKYVDDFMLLAKVSLVISLAISGITALLDIFTYVAFIIGYYYLVFISGAVGLIVMAFTADSEDIEPGEAGLKVLVFFAALALVVIAVGGWGGLNTASHFDKQMQYMPGDALFMGNALPYDKIPIVSEPYAKYIATSHLSDFGGNAIITDSEMIVSNQTPYWIFSVAPANTLAVNHLLGFVMVNAVDANYTEIFQNTYVGAGLWLFSDSSLRTYVSGAEYAIGNHYPQPAPDGKIDYVVTRDSYNYDGVYSFGGGVVYNPNGTVATTWQGITAPSWINQPWDKYVIDSLVSNWAVSRTGNHSFGFFARGFFTIRASPWMMQVDNGSELIPYGNATAYMQFLSPASNPNGLGGVILATGPHIYFYNMESMSMISASAAKATIQSKLPALSGATYFTANPVLYPVGSYYAWIVPYYSQESTTNIIQLQGIGIVDAENSAHFVDIQSQYASISSTGVEKLMSTAIESFLHNTTMIHTSNLTKVTGIITHLDQFDQNGSTVVAIQLNDSSWYFASASYMNDTEMVTVLSLTINETVEFEVSGSQVVDVVSP
jgi:hypothetical protein